MNLINKSIDGSFLTMFYIEFVYLLFLASTHCMCALVQWCLTPSRPAIILTSFSYNILLTSLSGWITTFRTHCNYSELIDIMNAYILICGI